MRTSRLIRDLQVERTAKLAVRAWYVASCRIYPGTKVPGIVDYRGDLDGLSAPDMARLLRGPYVTAPFAVNAARHWREVEGRQSDISLVLVSRGAVKHCNLYEERKP